jgi:hypothetical protein
MANFVLILNFEENSDQVTDVVSFFQNSFNLPVGLLDKFPARSVYFQSLH